jgi:hypothetical protein
MNAGVADADPQFVAPDYATEQTPNLSGVATDTNGF